MHFFISHSSQPAGSSAELPRHAALLPPAYFDCLPQPFSLTALVVTTREPYNHSMWVERTSQVLHEASLQPDGPVFTLSLRILYAEAFHFDTPGLAVPLTASMKFTFLSSRQPGNRRIGVRPLHPKTELNTRPRGSPSKSHRNSKTNWQLPRAIRRNPIP